MSDLYEDDIVTWSEQQAELLRRAARGKHINDQLDWSNIIEEVESVGRGETDAVMSLLSNAMGHKLRLIEWPEDPAVRHWRHEIRVWLAQVAKRHRASMHIKTALADLWQDATLDAGGPMLDAGPPSIALPEACPWTLDQLLAEGEAARRWRPGTADEGVP
jgi:hypothetical protein